MSDELDTLRNQIDKIDKSIVEKLNERAKAASSIGAIKNKSGGAIYVPSREEDLLNRLSKSNKGPLDGKAIRNIYREIISASISLEKKLMIAYLGPVATFTQQAAIKNFGSSVSYQPYNTIQDVFESVERAEADYAIIPIENSNEGGVSHSMDMLIESELKIVNEVYMPIEHCLISASALEDIKTIYSKDQALGQCRDWIRRNLPRAQLIASASTAHDVEAAAESGSGASIIGSALASKHYKVPIVGHGIQDKADNTTRFLIIGKETQDRPSKNGNDKTSALITINDESGALDKALLPFSKRNINLTKIESRPSRRKAWDYVFFIDFTGHWHDPIIQEAIEELNKVCPLIKWLGSYPNTQR